MDFVVPFSVGLVSSQVILSLILLSRSPVSSAQQRIYGALLIAVECYFILPFIHDTDAYIVIGAIEAGVPALFWLFSLSFFDDDYRFRPWQLGLLLLSMVLPSLGRGLRAMEFFELAALVSITTVFLKFSFLSLGLLAVIQHWKGDLISSRRYLRIWFCVTNGLYLLSYLFWRDVLDYPMPWGGKAEYLSSALIWVGTNGLLLQLAPGLLYRDSQKQVSSIVPISQEVKQTSHVNLPVIPEGFPAALHRELEEKMAYKDMDLSIGQLAYRLDMPEHVLRAIINGHMGYRNFKDFLNGFRIREAVGRLADPEELEVPILNIALDAGFRSLSTFNRVFKDTQDMTPSEFRKTKLPRHLGRQA